MDVKRFKSLPAELQALIATAVLLDGQDALTYLQADIDQGELLAEIAGDIVELEADLRVQLMGTFLREAVGSLSNGAER